MMKSVSWRLWLVIGLGVLAAYFSTPTVLYFFQPKEVRNDAETFQKTLPPFLPQSHIKLGLDIQGGVGLVLGIETESALDNYLALMAVEVQRWAEEEATGGRPLAVTSAYSVKGAQKLALVLNLENQPFEEFMSTFNEEFSSLVVLAREGNKVELGYTEAEVARIRESSLEQAERVIRSRVDKWGVSEPRIHRRQNGSILVQLPGFRNPEKAKELLGRTAQLQFKIVDDNFNGFSAVPLDALPPTVTLSEDGGSVPVFVGEDRGELVEFLSTYIPEDRQLLFEKEPLAGGKTRWSSLVVMAATEMTGEDIKNARVSYSSDGFSGYAVALEFSSLGGKRFSEITGRNINKRMAIVLDDVVESAPVIQQKISGGEASITFNERRPQQEIYEEAEQLALILRSGAVPATITILEERQVGSTLGPELAGKGIRGILLGLVAVLFFMMIFYRKPGLLACIVLSLNGLLLLAGMALFEFALTLPGIAGFILTLGMAVDANVLINERIRQELVGSKNAKKSLEEAWKKVFWTIIDANITTLIACTILLETNSSGPIRGFAITLMMGLMISLFTSLYVTRILMLYLAQRLSNAELRAWFRGDSSRRTWRIPFLNFAKPFSLAATLMCLVVIGTTMSKGLNWGVDFAGGTEMVVGFDAPVEGDTVRKVSRDSGLDNVTIQALGLEKKQYLIRYENVEMKADSSEPLEVTSSDQFIAFKEGLLSQMSQAGPKIEQIDFVGPQVGQELRVQGWLSVIYAIIGILLYIALRFDIRFGSGAIIKMLVDVVLVLGFYVFFQRTVDLTSVAAFLTVLGYSVNDTIVIYDRIRENLLLHPKKPLAEVINLSLNDTFTRTLNTSITTLAALTGILLLSTGQLWTFAMAIAVGVVVATASSTLIASAFLIAYETLKKLRTKTTPPTPSTSQA